MRIIAVGVGPSLLGYSPDFPAVGWQSWVDSYDKAPGYGHTLQAMFAGAVYCDEDAGADREGRWVLLVQQGERPHGVPSALRDALEKLEVALLERAPEGGLPEPMAVAVKVEGADYGPDYIDVRGWYVPAGRSWDDEWEVLYELDPQVRAKRFSARAPIWKIPPEVLTLHQTIGLREEPRRSYYQRALADLAWKDCSSVAKAHYDRLRDFVNSEPPVVLSLCVICRGIDDSLLRMLKSTRGHVDELVLLHTDPDGAPAEAVKQIVRLGLGYTVRVSQYLPDGKEPARVTLSDGSTSIENFSAARQACFDLARGLWRMFLDSDDTLEWRGPGPEQPLRDLLVKGPPSRFDRIVLPYIYSPSVTQQRAAIFRWLGPSGEPLWRWDGCPVHERVEPTVDATRVATMLVKNDVQDGFVIRHHQEPGHGDQSFERNALIAKRALDWHVFDVTAPQLAPRLIYTAAIWDLKQGDPAGEQNLRDLIASYPIEAYSFAAMLDLGRHLLATHRHDEVPTLLAANAELWGQQPEFSLLMARARAAGLTPQLAVRWFDAAYQQVPDTVEDVRTEQEDLQVQGRIDASRCYRKHGLYDNAVAVLDAAPPPWRGAAQLAGELHEARAEQATAQARAAALVLGHYLLSIDCVDKAAEVYEALPVDLRASSEAAKLGEALERRERHLVEAGEYNTTYNQLNGADLVVGAKGHQPAVLEKILGRDFDLFVDIGCNTGWMAIQVALARPDCLVLGVDTGAARVGEAQRRAAAAGLDPQRVHFVVNTDGHWAYDCVAWKKTWTLHTIEHRRVMVHCSEVLEHVKDPDDFLWAITDPSVDHILLTVPDVEPYHRLVPYARRLDLPLKEASKLAVEGAEHVRCFDAHELVLHLQRAKYVTEEVERISLFWQPGEGKRELLFAAGTPTEKTSGFSGRRIDILAKGFVPWGPRTHETEHVGGSEQAVAHLAPELVKLGYDVHVYGDPFERLDYYRSVWWHHYDEFRPGDPRHLCIVWRQPDRLLEIIRAARGRFRTVLWCHDTPAYEAIDLTARADEVWLLSEYQKWLYVDAGVPEEKTRVLQNGVNRAAVEKALELAAPVRQGQDWQKRVFWGSSADRGLLHLLRMWPSVKAQVPEAELFATYRQDLLRHPAAGTMKPKIAAEVERLVAELEPLGVHFFPGLAHQAYLNLAATCGVWAGCSNFDEISCIVAMEVQALGLDVVATDRAALAETVFDATTRVPWYVVERELREGGAYVEGGALWVPPGCFSQTYTDRLVAALREPPSAEERDVLSRVALDRFDWARTAQLFSAVIEAP